MFECVCKETFETKAALGSHKNWCDEVSGNFEKKKCPNCQEKIPAPFFERHLDTKECERLDTKKKIETEKDCDYGCGNKAKWKFKNGKLCCSEYFNKCSSVKKKNSVGVEKAWKEKPWSTGGNTGGGWQKDKTYEEVYGEEGAESVKNKISESIRALDKSTWDILSKDEEQEAKRKLRESINKRYENGWQPKAGRCEKITYESKTAGKVSLDGTCELKVAKYFDQKGIEWRRNTERFEYYNYLEERKAKYIPDFYIVDDDLFIEVKGYETELDRCKWSQFEPQLLVWKEKHLNKGDIL